MTWWSLEGTQDVFISAANAANAAQTFREFITTEMIVETLRNVFLGLAVILVSNYLIDVMDVRSEPMDSDDNALFDLLQSEGP